MTRRWWLAGVFLVCGCAACVVHAQNAEEAADAAPTFRTDARLVVVDVVVTDKHGQPVHGLTKDDFHVSEDGKGQAVRFFQDHTAAVASNQGAASQAQTEASLPPLPKNVFTNVPRVTPTDSVTVLLLDSLNTPLQDQTRVHAEILKYLKGVEPGRRLAIFGLSTRLRFIQGFTADPALLAAAMRTEEKGAGPQESGMLRSNGQQAAEQTAVNEMPAEAASAMKDFLADRASFEVKTRVQMTLSALEQLGGYLAGIPGRKNVIWFSGAFPINLLYDPNLKDPFGGVTFDDQLRKTSDVLAGAEVSLYPIASEGLKTDSLYDIDNRQNIDNPAQAQDAQQQQMQSDSIARAANHTTMDEIARDTGGMAVYNTNGIRDAIAKVVENGANYYTLTYVPAKKADGRYRKIQVKLEKGGYALAYRHGYFAPLDKPAMTANPAANTASAASSKTPGADPLLPYMGLGLPASTEVPMVLRIAPQGPSVGKLAGGNGALSGPLMRYAVDFVVAARGLQLTTEANGNHKGNIEATLLAYDQDGKALNWIVIGLPLDMDAAVFRKVEDNGVNFRLTLDVPKSAAYLRGGVYDLSTGLVGALEVPLTRVTTQVTEHATKPAGQ